MESKVSTGDKPKQPSAGFKNALIDMLNAHKRDAATRLKPPKQTPRDHNKVKIRNSTSEALRRGEVVEFSDFRFTQIQPDALWFTGSVPDLTNVGWGVTLKPIPEDEIGEVLVLGVTIAHVKIEDEDHEYAAREDGETVLKSQAAQGPVKILYKPTGGTPPEERECVVQLMDETGGDPPLLVSYTHLPSGYVASSTERRFYPKLCDEAWVIKSDGTHEQSSDRPYIVNMGDLPLYKGWAIVEKAYTDPDYGEVWAVVKVLSNSPRSGAMYDWLSPDNIGEWSLNPTEEVLLRTASNGGSAEEPGVGGDVRRWVFAYGGDIMLSHPGTYEVTFGARVILSSTDAPRNTETTSDASAGTAHTHTFFVPTSVNARIGVQQNFQPGVSSVGGTTINGDDSVLKIAVSIPNATYEAEKTFVFTNQFEPWHELFYTRLSLFFAVDDDVGYESSGTPTVVLQRAWMIVRPGQQDDADQGFGSGLNQYPSGRSGSFIWYGSTDSGDEPAFLDKDGAEI
jgi:hypothetical protein